MARTTTDIGKLARALKAPSFKNPDASPDLSGLDPVSPTTMVLRIAEIKAYEHNPRRAENREYPRLKDSIRTRRGLTTPLTVTKRPGDDLYTIAAGGNSRLRALKELAEETRDEAFALVMCRFEPWDSECQVFANHLIENDVRGTMTFGDKARAILEWRRLYAESHPEEPPLSQRQLAECLAATGYRVPRTLLTPLLYAAEFLLPHLPIVFGSGLGRPAVERLVRLRSCCAQYWREQAPTERPNTEAAFDEVFARICTQQDCHSADWDHELFQSAFIIEVAKGLGRDHKRVALDIDSLYHGYSLETPEALGAPPANDPQGLQSEWAFARAREVDASKRERAKARIQARARADTRPDRTNGEPAALPIGDTSSVVACADACLDPSELREHNYVAARRLAARHALDQLLKSAATGFGFFVEPPEPSAVSPESRDRAAGPSQGLVLTGLRSGLWWLLCLAADQLVPAHVAALGKAYPASWLVELMNGLPKRSPETDPVAALHLLVGEPTARGLVDEVLMHQDFMDEDFSALEQLLRGCRRLRSLAADGGLALWEMSR